MYRPALLEPEIITNIILRMYIGSRCRVVSSLSSPYLFHKGSRVDEGAS